MIKAYYSYNADRDVFGLTIKVENEKDYHRTINTYEEADYIDDIIGVSLESIECEIPKVIVDEIMKQLSKSLDEHIVANGIKYHRTKVFIEPDDVEYKNTYGYNLRHYYIPNGDWGYVVDSNNVIQDVTGGNYRIRPEFPKGSSTTSNHGSHLLGRKVVHKSRYNPITMDDRIN